MGKKTVVLCVALICITFAAIAALGIYSFRPLIPAFPFLVFATIVLLAISFIAVFGLKSIDKTLEKHPQSAFLDGPDIVRMREIDLTIAKNTPALSDTPSIPDPSMPLELIESSASAGDEEQK